MILVYVITGPAQTLRRVPGPADMQGLTGRVIVRGEPTDEDVSRWGHALGAFILRGGETF